ncbi:MAG TPA: amidase [Candidatus Limnocylindria bacterium]|nr:amidase [Candidatus Limnocylindria bacterium]
MPFAEPAALGAADGARAVREGALSSLALVEAALARIRALDGGLQAWVHLDAPGALAAARARDDDVRAGRPLGPLHGVPVGVKDIFHVAGMPTTAGARPHFHARPTRDAPCVALLRAAGAVILGKTATTEFAYRDPAPTHNPWHRGHTPGGSSAGSAAAVAARMIPLALGSQTVGSVLRPAAYCGIVGFKPTHGLVSTEDVVPLAWSLDHVGVLARSVEDAALGVSVLSARALAPEPLRAPRLAVAPALFERVAGDVAAHLGEITRCLQRAGATVVEVPLPPAFAAIHAAGLTVLAAEAAAYHEREYAGYAAELGAEIRALVAAGLKVPPMAYARAQQARLAFRDAMRSVLTPVDALLSPTAPTAAPAGLASTGDGSLCAPWTFAGVPAITLPTGVAPSGLPHALQLVQAVAAEARLLGAAAWCERVIGFSARPPES